MDTVRSEDKKNFDFGTDSTFDASIQPNVGSGDNNGNSSGAGNPLADFM